MSESKGENIDADLGSDLPAIDADPGRMQQVVWNLLVNATKFTPAGGRVSVETRSPDPLTVRMRVSDNGIGIPAEFLPHVFERFRQADGSATRQYGGLGLGLSLVRSLIEAHGGTVAVTSEGRGCGATFTVWLPTARQAERDLASNA